MVEYAVRHTGGDYLCVVILIKMILEKEGYDSDVINRITSSIPVNIPSGYEFSSHSIYDFRESSDSSKWGVEVTDSMFNNLFAKQGIRLACLEIDVHRYHDYEFGDFMQSMIYKGQHVMLGVDYGLLIKDSSRIGYMHTCLLLGMDHDNITLYNPGPHEPGDIQVDIGDFYRAIHLGRGGIWIFKNTD